MVNEYRISEADLNKLIVIKQTLDHLYNQNKTTLASVCKYHTFPLNGIISRTQLKPIKEEAT
jgi:hypothetical protein